MLPRLLVAVSATTIVVNVGLFCVLAAAEPRTLALWLGLVVSGVGSYLVRARYLAARGSPLADRVGDDR